MKYPARLELKRKQEVRIPVKKRNHDNEFLVFVAASTFQAPAQFTDTHYDMIDYQQLEESLEEK